MLEQALEECDLGLQSVSLRCHDPSPRAAVLMNRAAIGREPVKVLHVLQTLGIGGMERRVLRLANGLDPQAFEVHAISLRPTAGEPLPWPLGRHEFFPVAPGLQTQRLLDLVRYIRAGGYRIVHSHNWATMFYGVLAGRLAGTEVVLHGEHGLNQDDWRGISTKREIIGGLLARIATRIVAVNAFVARQTQDRWKLPPERIVSIPNGVDLGRFVPRSRDAAESFVIGTVARFDQIKNLPCLLRGFALFRRGLPDLGSRLVIVGSGREFEPLKALTAALGLEGYVDFPGETGRPEDWYTRFDAFANTSLSEGMSNTVLEAMACGLPIVASAVDGNRCWLAENENALFFTSDDHRALADCLATLAHDPGVRRKIGTANRIRVECEFDNAQFVRSYRELYESLLGSMK